MSAKDIPIASHRAIQRIDCHRWLGEGSRVARVGFIGNGFFDIESGPRVCFDPRDAGGALRVGKCVIARVDGSLWFSRLPDNDWDFAPDLLAMSAKDLEALALAGDLSMDSASAYFIAQLDASNPMVARRNYLDTLEALGGARGAGRDGLVQKLNARRARKS